MRSLREYADVRLEIKLRIMTGELRNCEDEFEKLELIEFISAWRPEVRDACLMIKFMEKPYEDEDRDRNNRKGNRAIQPSFEFSPEAD